MNNFEELKKLFPDMYKDVYCGCDHPKGWDELVMRLSKQLDSFLIEIKVAQTKEKFGGLRFYVDYNIPAHIDGRIVNHADELITRAEDKSLVTCQDCGSLGKLYTDGWLLTLCEKCAEKRGRVLGVDPYEGFEDKGLFWVQTYSGKQFDLLYPTPDMICMVDIATALSNICRYTGQINNFYTVEEHSIHVSNLVPEELAVYGFLHDAAEAYIGDINKPLKDAVDSLTDNKLSAIEEKVQIAVLQYFNLPLEYDRKPIKVADVQCAVVEHKQLFNDYIEWKYDNMYEVVDIEIECLEPMAAFNAFMSRAVELGLPCNTHK